MSIDLIAPDGQPWVLDNEDPKALDEALAQGFKMPVAPREKSGLEEVADTAAAGVTGAVEGLTGGALGAAIGLGAKPDSHGFVDPARLAAKKEVNRLREENPTASTVGELTGVLGSPINAASELVRGSLGATTALGRVGASALGGAASNTLFGAGKLVSDTALGDTDLTAEKLIAYGGLGALLGGAGGGIGGAIEEGARALLPKAATLATRAQSALDDIANDAAVRSTRAQQSAINKLGDDKFAAVAKALRERGHLKLTPQAMADSLEVDRTALGKTLGKFLDDAEAAGSKPDLMRVVQRLDDFESSLNPLERQSIAKDISAARRSVAELGATGNDGYKALDAVKRTVQDKAKFSRGPIPDDDVTFGLKRQLAGVFRDEIDQQLLPTMGADTAKAFTEAKATYGALKDAERLAASGLGRPGGLGYLGLKDLAAAAAASTAHPMGIAAAIGSKVLREHGQAIIARIADRLAKEPALAAMAKSFATALPQTVPKLGQYGAILANEASLSPERALAAHIAYAQLDPGYAAHAQLAGLTPETPAEVPHVMQRAQMFAEAAAATKAHDEAVQRGIERVMRGSAAAADTVSGSLKTQDFGAMRMRRDSAAAHDKRVEEVRQLAADPEALLKRVAANLNGVGQSAPGVAAAMTNTAHRAVTYLAQQAEVPAKLGPLAPEWVPTEAERHSFAQKLEVVEDPMKALHHAAAGTLTQEHIDALKAVYPALARSMADKALEAALSGKDVPYRARMMLSLLTGVDMDGTLSADAIARNQAPNHASSEKPQDAAATHGSGSEMTLGKRTALPQQQRELENAP